MNDTLKHSVPLYFKPVMLRDEDNNPVEYLELQVCVSQIMCKAPLNIEIEPKGKPKAVLLTIIWSWLLFAYSYAYPILLLVTCLTITW